MKHSQSDNVEALRRLFNNFSLEGEEMLERKPTKTIAQIQADLAKPYPSREKSKRMGGNTINFIPWYECVSIANAVTDGQWEYRIVKSGHSEVSKKFEMVVEVTIHASDGSFSRQGTGSEDSSTDNYGDYQSIAESMALRRAFTKFQLGVYMYRK